MKSLLFMTSTGPPAKKKKREKVPWLVTWSALKFLAALVTGFLGATCLAFRCLGLRCDEPKTPPQKKKNNKGGPVPWLVPRSALWFLGASVAKSLGATWLAFGVAPWPHSSPLARVFAASSSARPRRVQHTKADTSLHLSLFHLHLHCRTALPCFTCTAPTCLSCPFLHCPVCCLLLHC